MILGVFVLCMNLLPTHPSAPLAPAANAQVYEPWQEIENTWLWIPENQCDLVWADVFSASSAGFAIQSQGRGGRGYNETEIGKLYNNWLENCLYCTPGSGPNPPNVPWGGPTSGPFKCHTPGNTIEEDLNLYWDHFKACNPPPPSGPSPDDFIDALEQWRQAAGGDSGGWCMSMNPEDCPGGPGCGPAIGAAGNIYENEFGSPATFDIIEQIIQALGCNDNPHCGPGGPPNFDPGLGPCGIDLDGNPGIQWFDLAMVVILNEECNGGNPLSGPEFEDLIGDWLDCLDPDPEICGNLDQWLLGLPYDMPLNMVKEYEEESGCTTCWNPPSGGPGFELPHPPGQFPCDLYFADGMDPADFLDYFKRSSWCNLGAPPAGGGNPEADPADWPPFDLVNLGAIWTKEIAGCSNPAPPGGPCDFGARGLDLVFNEVHGRGMNAEEMGMFLMLIGPGDSLCGHDPGPGCDEPPSWPELPGIPNPPPFDLPIFDCDPSGDGVSDPLDLKWYLGQLHNCHMIAGGPTPDQMIFAAGNFLNSFGTGMPCSDFEDCDGIGPVLFDVMGGNLQSQWLGMVLQYPDTGCGGNMDPPNTEPEPPALPGPGPIGPPSGPPPVWFCGAGVAAATTPEPVMLGYGHKLEVATDLTIAVPGPDLEIVRSYSSRSLTTGSSIIGRNWSLNVLQFLKYVDANNLRIYDNAGSAVNFKKDGTQWKPPGPATQFIEEDTGSTPPVYRVIEPGAYEVKFFHNNYSTTLLRGLLYEQSDPYGNYMRYVYAVIGGQYRLDRIYINGEDDTSYAAKLQFNWNIGGNSHGKLHAINVWRQPSSGDPVITQQVKYTYKETGDDLNNAIGTDDDLVQVVVLEHVDQSPADGGEFHRKVTQYRYHDSSNENGNDLDNDGFEYESGGYHQLKAIIQPEQIEYAIQKKFAGSPAVKNVAAEAKKLLKQPDGYVVFTESGQPFTIMDLAAKVIEKYHDNNYDFPQTVATQYIQSACGCSGGSTQGRKLVHEYYEFTTDSTHPCERGAMVIEYVGENDNYTEIERRLYGLNKEGINGEDHYRTLNIARKVTGQSSHWVTAYEYNSTGDVIKEYTPAAMQSYSWNTTNGPSYTPGSTGLAYTYGYTNHRRTSVSVGQGTGTPTLVSETIPFSTAQHLPGTIKLYRVAGSSNPDDIETTTFDYGFKTSAAQGDIAWVEIETEAETTSENGPGSTYSEYRLYDSQGNNNWTQAPDTSLTRRTFDSKTGALTVLERNAPVPSLSQPTPAGWTTTGRNADGGSLTTNITNDLLGRPTVIADPRGIKTRIVRQLRTSPDRQGIGYFAVITLPDAVSDGGSDYLYNSPANITWLNAGGDAFASYDMSLDDEASGSDFGTLFTGYDFSLNTLVAKSTSTHALSGLVLNDKRWHSIAGDGESSGVYTTSYEYDLQGRIENLTAANGTVTNWHYNEFGEVNIINSGTIAGPSGNMLPVIEYAYDTDIVSGVGNRRLTELTQHVDGSATRVTTLAYDERDRLAKINPPVPPALRMAYDNLDRITAEATFDALNATNVAQTSGRGSLVEYFYSQRGLLYRQSVDLTPSDGASDTLSENFWFDQNGRPVGTWGPNRPMTKVSYNGLGMPKATYTTDRRGDADYDDVFNAHTAVVGDDVVLEEAEIQYITSAGARRGLVDLITSRRRVHDVTDTSLGALSAFASTNRYITSYQAAYYDSLSRLIAAQDFGTNRSDGLFGYNAASAPTINQASPPTPGPNEDTLISSIAYDASRGRVDHVTDPMGRITKLFYDDLDRRVAVAENAQTSPPPTVTWNSTSLRWIAGGMDDAYPDRNRTTSYVYNGVDNIVQQIAHLHDGTTETAQITKYIYAASDGVNNNQINSFDLLTEVHYPDGDNGLPGTDEKYKVRYAYNRLGELRYAEDQNDTTHTYTRDSLGRVTRDDATVDSLSGIDGTIVALTMTYDNFGRPEFARSRLSGDTIRDAVKYTYNAFGQLHEFWQEPAGDVTGSSLKTVYGYTNSVANLSGGNASNYSRLTQLTYPNGLAVGYTYGTSNSAHDRISRLTQFGPTGSKTNYEYIGANLLATIEYVTPFVLLDRSFPHNGQRAQGVYPGLDQYGRIARQTWVDGAIGAHPFNNTVASGTPYVEQTFSYDNNGNKKTAYDSRPYGSTTITSRPNKDFEYVYDGLNRLTEAKRGVRSGGPPSNWVPAPSPSSGMLYAASQQWKLDFLGNHLSADSDLDADGTYESTVGGELIEGDHNFANELLERTIIASPNVELPFTYDKAGNMKEKAPGPGDDARYVYTYDAWNRLVKVEYKSTPLSTPVTRAELQYNAVHQITEKRA